MYGVMATSLPSFHFSIMPSFDPAHHNRRTVRLKGHDYAGIGLYFVTICASRTGNVFGLIREGQLLANSHGKIAIDAWEETANLRPEVQFDSCCLMPDHFHALIWIEGHKQKDLPSFGHRTPRSLGALIGGWKGACSRGVEQMRRERNWPSISLWQRNYYDHIVRDEREMELIRRYISNNPLVWDKDNHWE